MVKQSIENEEQSKNTTNPHQINQIWKGNAQRIYVQIQLPEGTEAQVRPRSGLALKYGITVLNSPGTIDAGYRGEVGVILINHGKEVFHVEQHMRIAQLVVQYVPQVKLEEVDVLEASARGEQGFGSSGTK